MEHKQHVIIKKLKYKNTSVHQLHLKSGTKHFDTTFNKSVISVWKKSTFWGTSCTLVIRGSSLSVAFTFTLVRAVLSIRVRSHYLKRKFLSFVRVQMQKSVDRRQKSYLSFPISPLNVLHWYRARVKLHICIAQLERHWHDEVNFSWYYDTITLCSRNSKPATGKYLTYPDL